MHLLKIKQLVGAEAMLAFRNTEGNGTRPYLWVPTMLSSTPGVRGHMSAPSPPGQPVSHRKASPYVYETNETFRGNKLSCHKNDSW